MESKNTLVIYLALSRVYLTSFLDPIDYWKDLIEIRFFVIFCTLNCWSNFFEKLFPRSKFATADYSTTPVVRYLVKRCIHVISSAFGAEQSLQMKKKVWDVLLFIWVSEVSHPLKKLFFLLKMKTLIPNHNIFAQS